VCKKHGDSCLQVVVDDFGDVDLGACVWCKTRSVCCSTALRRHRGGKSKVKVNVDEDPKGGKRKLSEVEQSEFEQTEVEQTEVEQSEGSEGEGPSKKVKSRSGGSSGEFSERGQGSRGGGQGQGEKESEGSDEREEVREVGTDEGDDNGDLGIGE
jgi:hypothetical protein